MDINFTKSRNNLVFAELKERDVFYCCDDKDDIPALYMVIVPVDSDEFSGESISYNCVCLNGGFLDRVEPYVPVKLCKATINIEG